MCPQCDAVHRRQCGGWTGHQVQPGGILGVMNPPADATDVVPPAEVAAAAAAAASLEGGSVLGWWASNDHSFVRRVRLCGWENLRSGCEDCIVAFAVEALRGTLTGDQGVEPMCGSDASPSAAHVGCEAPTLE